MKKFNLNKKNFYVKKLDAVRLWNKNEEFRFNKEKECDSSKTVIISVCILFKWVIRMCGLELRISFDLMHSLQSHTAWNISEIFLEYWHGIFEIFQESSNEIFQKYCYVPQFLSWNIHWNNSEIFPKFFTK